MVPDIIENHIPDGLAVYADPLIGKVFFNIMENAVRHGGNVPVIRFSARSSHDGVSIVCEDDGAGIPADEREKIFERGYGRNTGMGLFLSREILGISPGLPFSRRRAGERCPVRDFHTKRDVPACTGIAGKVAGESVIHQLNYGNGSLLKVYT